jgi:lipooligosaccharide transport system permease protein
VPVSQVARVVEHHAYAFKPFWRYGVVSSIVTPALFLAALGLGLGSLVERGDDAALGGAGYLAFVGSGLLAATSMQVAANESMFPVMAGIKWVRTWHGLLASPIGIGALVAGQFAWTALRLLVGAALYLAVLTAFGAVDRPLAVLAVPAAALCGMAFATPIAAFSSTQENDQGFMVLFRVVIMPLFLFSGTFFPVDQLPAAMRTFAQATPLFHGVELCRGLVLGGLRPGPAAVHVAYLSAWTAVGWAVARRTFATRLVS